MLQKKRNEGNEGKARENLRKLSKKRIIYSSNLTLQDTFRENVTELKKILEIQENFGKKQK